MRHLLAAIFILTCLLAKSQSPEPPHELVGNSPTMSITAGLGVPFGTVAKLEAEIYDGDNVHDKAHEYLYLLKINSVNGKIIKGTLLFDFTDKTGTLANDDLALSELIYHKDESRLSDNRIEKMKKAYVGKKVTVMAYETGEFIGRPKNDEYSRIVSEPFYFFRHYLIVVYNLEKGKMPKKYR